MHYLLKVWNQMKYDGNKSKVRLDLVITYSKINDILHIINYY